MTDQETEDALEALPSYCVMEWCQYKGEEGVAAPNYEATRQQGRVMIDLSYCMTEALNGVVLRTVPYVNKHFSLSRLSAV